MPGIAIRISPQELADIDKILWSEPELSSPKIREKYNIRLSVDWLAKRRNRLGIPFKFLFDRQQTQSTCRQFEYTGPDTWTTADGPPCSNRRLSCIYHHSKKIMTVETVTTRRECKFCKARGEWDRYCCGELPPTRLGNTEWVGVGYMEPIVY
jgi:hypothetical protein